MFSIVISNTSAGFITGICSAIHFKRRIKMIYLNQEQFQFLPGAPCECLGPFNSFLGHHISRNFLVFFANGKFDEEDAVWTPQTQMGLPTFP